MTKGQLVDRVEPRQRFTPMERLAALMVGRGLTYRQAANQLQVKWSTAKMHIEGAARKLPGKDPPRMKLTYWARGASVELLAPGMTTEDWAALSED